MAGTVQGYNKWVEYAMTGVVDMVTDTFKLAVVNGYVFNAADDVYGDISVSEIAQANGYTSGGYTLNNKTFGYNTGLGKTKFDADDINIAASGGSIGPFTGAVVYSSTTGKLFYYIDFGETVTVLDATSYLLVGNTNGFVNITKGS